MARKIITYTAEKATPAIRTTAEFLICCRVNDPYASPEAKWRGTCCECGEPIVRRDAMPNPNAKLICVQCWSDLPRP